MTAIDSDASESARPRLHPVVLDLAQYTIEQLRNDGELVLYRGQPRAHRDTSRATILLLAPASAHPSRSSLSSLQHEYSLRRELDPAYAARPYALIEAEGRTLLVLEDPGGTPLEQLVDGPMQVERFLRLAIGITRALGQVHNRELVHKDIKPANILVDDATGRVWLTGFGIASRLPRERQSPESPEFIAGTLAYMAPEQTGRMNRSIDSRSDLYALGVTLYQMLVGRLPFSAAEPMEWVHCHIARRPPPPAERLESVPAPISEIVMKLIAKTAEERYQTTAGLEHDLGLCLAEWVARSRIDSFPLGEDDTPGRLLIPEKLYGREREIGTLLAAFEQVVISGTPQLVLISGYSGIGKSSVVNELHKVLVPRGLFAAGKFDQYMRDIPYATLGQAFQSLIRQLLAKNDADLAPWREALRGALGPNGQLMVDLVPELKLIIGDQPPVSDLPAQQAQGRFQLVFRRFIGVFARPEHPLALFLDDLQWLDAATLNLLGDLFVQRDVAHLLLIGAYRDNEVDAAHPLVRKLDAIRHTGALMQEISLAPLARDDVGQLMADTLRCEPARAAPLAQLLHERTAGNPFFLMQFLHALAEEGLLAFEHEQAQWSWDLERIHAKGYTENVVDLMVGKLHRLPAETRTAMQQLACLGNVADITILSIVLATSEEQVREDLWAAVRLELIERLASSYKFVHDRVREAVYTLIPEESRAQAHLRIGRLLAAHTPPGKRGEAIFEIVNQLNRGLALISSAEEREQLAELNLVAGQRAKASTAYASALTYHIAAAALLPEDSWERRHELMFALELNRAECEFLTGELQAAEERLAILSTRAGNTVEHATVACLRMDVYTTLEQSGRAVAVGLDYLGRLGIEWSLHPTEEEAQGEYSRICSQLADRTIDELVDLPLMSDPLSLATLDVLTRIATPAQYTDVNLYVLVICRAVDLSLERGNSDGSCAAYVTLGRIAGGCFGDYQAAFRFGGLGYELVERRGLKRFQSRTDLMFGAFVTPWTRHVRTGRDLLRRALETANQTGDLTFAGYGCANLNTHLLSAGDPLIEVQREAENGLAFVRKARASHVIDLITTQLKLIRTLRGLTPTFGCFDDGQFEELSFERRFSESPLAECRYWVRKLQARFFAGDYATAIDAASRAQKLLWTSPSSLETAEYHFYAALSRAASCDFAAAGERQQHIEALAAHRKQLQVWADNCPENFENRAALVGAEIARTEGRELEAERLYEQAICSARAHGFVHNEALANELASRFYAARGFETISQAYLRNARHGYLRWGADGKVRQLDEAYPHLREEQPLPNPSSTIGTPVEHLDLATVISVAQAVSGEMVLQKLINTLMRIAVEQAGAERGVLVLSGAREPRIAGEATTGGGALVVHLRDEPLTASALPQSILHYVMRTQESMTIDDAAAESPFSEDPYVRRHQALSILCLPLLTQAKLIGLLYLENSLAPRVFAPSRITVLKLLASQAAISLENTRLYRDLAEREARIRRLVDADIVGICIWNFDGHIVEANEAFLRMVGYDREDLLAGRIRWTDMTPPDWHDSDARALREHKATGLQHPYEKEFFRKDGSRVPVLLGAATLEEGGNEGVAFALDLTERKRAEYLTRQAFDSSPDGVSVVGRDYRYQRVNPLYERNWKIPTERIVGMHVADLVGRDMFERTVKPNLERCFAGEHAGYADWFTNALGLRYLSVSCTPLRLDAERVDAALVITRDLTEHMHATEALHEAQAALARVNRVATLGVLTASIAHEVNQPIAAVVNGAAACLRWLSAQPPDLQKARRSLERIAKDGQRAGDIVHRIRALVKRQPQRKELVDLNQAIVEVIALVRDLVRSHEISLETRLAPDLPPVQGDRVQLQQVILNLVGNAVEAMSAIDDRPRRLTIASANDAPREVQVEVRDSGPGLDRERAEEIFEAFYTTKTEGLGMGLSISRSIIEAHGGRLWATANAPHGAVFQFSLPINDNSYLADAGDS